MKLSTDRILTTHVGSLPRTQDVSAALFSKMRGESFEEAAYDAAIRDGVALAVRPLHGRSHQQ